MELKRVCLFLVGVLFLLLLNEIGCIATREENFISDEERRAADAYHSNLDSDKRGLYETSGTFIKPQTYPSAYGQNLKPQTYPSAYGQAFSSPGYGTAYYPGAYSSGHGSFGGFGLSGHGTNYGHSPSYGHGHGGLALKGLLIPLAGIALLGAAAALSSNPVLLQLGVVNGRRRRRRSLDRKTNRA
ncbi:uncharacterized protein [Tenebrio molitor]|uniref:uncharacterized protein n=1 Tax=Tenebrio molitor TaxID=7067 RepID=UPI0036249E4A